MRHASTPLPCSRRTDVDHFGVFFGAILFYVSRFDFNVRRTSPQLFLSAAPPGSVFLLSEGGLFSRSLVSSIDLPAGPFFRALEAFLSPLPPRQSIRFFPVNTLVPRIAARLRREHSFPRVKLLCFFKTFQISKVCPDKFEYEASSELFSKVELMDDPPSFGASAGIFPEPIRGSVLLATAFFAQWQDPRNPVPLR